MKVQITVRGRTYTLRSDQDEDLREIARVVDHRMSEIASKSPRMDEYTVAMLTAMNIASELERFRRTVDRELADLDRDLAATTLLLESASRGSADRGGPPDDTPGVDG